MRVRSAVMVPAPLAMTPTPPTPALLPSVSAITASARRTEPELKVIKPRPWVPLTTKRSASSSPCEAATTPPYIDAPVGVSNDDVARGDGGSHALDAESPLARRREHDTFERGVPARADTHARRWPRDREAAEVQRRLGGHRRSGRGACARDGDARGAHADEVRRDARRPRPAIRSSREQHPGLLGDVTQRRVERCEGVCFGAVGAFGWRVGAHVEDRRPGGHVRGSREALLGARARAGRGATSAGERLGPCLTRSSERRVAGVVVASDPPRGARADAYDRRIGLRGPGRG